MSDLLALRPFLPVKDMARSRAFYEAIGFAATIADATVTIMKMGSFSLILQNHYVQDWADNTMVQLMVRDVEPWWETHVNAALLVDQFAVKPPRPPVMQPWGLIVGFLFDPAGVLLHVAEAPF